MSNSRFEKLERPRSEDADKRDDKTTHGASLGRFSTDSSEARATEDAPKTMERFEADGTQGLRVERTDENVQPFIRCPVCERDWGRFDTRCGQCGEALDSQKAHAFNAALWHQRLAERKIEDAGVAERALEHEKAAHELVEQKRRYGALLAEEVKHQYQKRDTDDPSVSVGWGWNRGYGYQSLGGIPLFAMLAFGVRSPIRWMFAAVSLGLILSNVGAWAWRKFFKEKD